MRSRYSAFVVGDAGYLLATWHPRTRPEMLDPADDIEWRGLEVLDTVAGGPGDDHGVVEFVARFWDPTLLQRGEQQERSTFVREDGRWFYVGVAADN